MKKRGIFLLLPIAWCTLIAAQDSTLQKKYIRRPAIGISFFFNDFITPQRIRATSLSSVLSSQQHAKLKEMDPGISVSYFKGVSRQMDFALFLTGSFVRYDLENRPIANEQFFLETDASLNIKLMSEKYWFTPYASLGAGVSKYGVYYGAFVPAGVGFKLNLFDEAHVFYQSQYRIPVTTNTASHHFMHMIGIAGVVSSK